jgi:DNA-binding transcriptional regulator YhcF (GntR family)
MPSVVQFQPNAQGKQPERFLKLRHSLLYSEGYQSLPAVAQALYVRIAARYNGRNNGQIPYSARDAKRELHVGQYTAYRAFKKLRDQGLIIRRKRGSFVRKTHEAKASEWELTEFSLAGSLEQSEIHQVAPKVPDHQFAAQVPADTCAANPTPAPSCAKGTLLDRSSKSLDIDKREQDSANSKGRSLSRQEVKPSEDPQPFPCLPNTINRVPRVAAPGDVARGSDEVLIPFDTPNADLAERFMARAIGKPFIRSGRSRGFYLARSELDSILAFAAAEGAVGT